MIDRPTPVVRHVQHVQHLLRTLLATLSLLWAGLCPAHEISMAEVELRQTGPAEFIWYWGAGNRTGETVLRPRWPAGCADDAGVLRCGPAGLSGSLGMEGVGERFSAVLVKVHWADGQSRVYTLTAGQPSVTLYGSADDQRGMGEIARAYGLLGVEHILAGVDHLLFVIGLLFLVGFNRRLVLTITAFTAAHSLTLALSALGWLTLRPPPVEAVIALSIMLVAAEGLHTRQTLSRRWPALVALLFGLVHGLGFAGALKEIGLPDNHLAVALLTFNLGVELGQLLVVALAGLVVLAARRWRPDGHVLLTRLRAVALYAIGGMAAFWTLQRVSAFVA
ncbi:MAG: HupE/UreJ family protein [Rubrivivax sp.]|nr:HupE/UreJ family protein [Rubrivivax sp.]